MITIRLNLARAEFTAERLRTRSKEFLIKRNSELCELCVSVLKSIFFSSFAVALYQLFVVKS